MYKRFLKRLIDFLVSLFATIFFSPIMIIIAVLVRCKLGSPVLFIQNRPGLNGEIFRIYKFRTMIDKRHEDGRFFSDSVRITEFGKKLRASSLDELPELLNILKGEMSFVGPRPLLVKYLPLYNERQKRRHEVRPGLTGFAQIKGRNAIKWEEKFQMDVEYVENLSFFMDLKIVCLTIIKVLKRDGINSKSDTTMESFEGTS